MVYICAVALSLDNDVTDFLDNYQHITNQLACIVRSYAAIDYLRILAAVGVIIGIHLIEPFQSLTSSSKTNYSKLMTSFPQLYFDLTTTSVENLLDFTKPAFNFISNERFKSTKYKDNLLSPTLHIIENYHSDVCNTLNILLPQLAKKFKQVCVYNFY